MKKIVHIVNSLHPSGAEKMLFRLLSAHKVKESTSLQIVVLNNNYDEDFFKEFKELVEDIHVIRSKNILMKILDVKKILKLVRPDLIQTWMYEADVIGGIAGRFSNIKVIWNVRSIKPANHSLVYLKIIGILSWIIPFKIISNSKRAIVFKVKNFYNKHKFVYIPNGYDFNSISSSNSISGKVGNDIVFGNVSRFDSTKGLNFLFEAISELQKNNIFPYFKFFGAGMTLDNTELVQMIAQKGMLIQNIEFNGFVKSSDIIFNSFDVLCQSSVTESFPNVIIEGAMYGKIILSTKTGDLETILNNTNYLCETHSSYQISILIKNILKADNKLLANISKNNIKLSKSYNIDRIANIYNELYSNII
jgi:glycosyltransferase involved in cell wall biosynthesis